MVFHRRMEAEQCTANPNNAPLLHFSQLRWAKCHNKYLSQRLAVLIQLSRHQLNCQALAFLLRTTWHGSISPVIVLHLVGCFTLKSSTATNPESLHSKLDLTQQGITLNTRSGSDDEEDYKSSKKTTQKQDVLHESNTFFLAHLQKLPLCPPHGLHHGLKSSKGVVIQLLSHV